MIENIEQGDILLLRFPYSNMIDYKIRPALVISNNTFNAKHDPWFCPITSAKSIQSIPLTGCIQDGKLAKESFANTSQVATIEKDLILKKLGNTSEEKTKEIVEKIIQNLN